MTSSEQCERDVLKSLLFSLSENELQARIDEPIDCALGSYQVEGTPSPTFDCFRILATDLVQHVSRNGAETRRERSQANAFAEAMELLDSDYPGSWGSGSENALLDFIEDPEGVFERIAFVIGEGMKKKKRASHFDLVLLEMLSTDWTKRREFVSIILEMYGDFLPSEVRNCQHDQLVDSIGELIRSLVQSEAIVAQVLQGRPSDLMGV